MGIVACPTFDLGHMAVACMYIDMAHVDIGVEASMQICWVVTGPYDFSFFPIGEVVQSVLPVIALEWVSKVALLAGHLDWPSFFTYLDNNWPNVGPDLTSRPTAFTVLVFHVPISGRRGLKARGRRGSWALSDRPLELFGLSGGVPNRSRMCVRPSAMRKIGAHAWFLARACPPTLKVVMVTFKVSPPSGVFSATTFLQEILLFSSAFHGSPMITYLPLPLSAMLGRIRTFLPSKSITFIGKGSVSTCISWNFNRPSLMADWIYHQNTLQSLVAWENELCHLQYARCFSSSPDGTLWFILILSFLSNSSNILSHLPTLNANLTSSWRFFWTGCKEEKAEDLACFGQTISAAYSSFDSLSELLYGRCDESF
jgi:hypothetical protein